MKINLAVLFGGKSTEHEISIISALQAIENLDVEKYNIIPIYIDKKGDFYAYDKKVSSLKENPLADSKNFSDLKNLLKKVSKICFVKDSNKVYIKKVEDKIFGNKIISQIDVAFPIVHGTNVEDGNLQGFIHIMNIPFVGCDCISSALGMDKYVMKKLLQVEGINVVDGIKLDNNDYKNLDDTIKKIEDKFNYPVIVKPVNLGSSIGIKKAKDKNDLKDALELAFSYASVVIVERAIVNLREINCSVVGDKLNAETSVLEEPFGNDEILSFVDKYMSGGKGMSKAGKTGSGVSNFSKTGGAKLSGTKSQGMASLKRQVPANVTSEMEEKIRTMALKTFKILGCSGVCRIDFLVDKDNDEVFVTEINTIPGSLSYYLWEPKGVKYKELLDRLIKIAIDNHRREENLNFVFESNVLCK